MKSIQLILFSFLLLGTIVSCSKDDDFQMSETVFINDPYYPGLPIYSEWGYNTFGAYIDRKPFVSTDSDLPSKIIVNGDTLHILLRGRMNYENVDLTFSIVGFSPKVHSDLVELDKTIIDLKAPGNVVTIKIGNALRNLDIIEGDMEIKRAQHLYLDENPVRVILSGSFKFKTFLEQEPISVSHGRFDLGFGYDNFYNY